MSSKRSEVRENFIAFVACVTFNFASHIINFWIEKLVRLQVLIKIIIIGISSKIFLNVILWVGQILKTIDSIIPVIMHEMLKLISNKS
jgi:hypothetical protein